MHERKTCFSKCRCLLNILTALVQIAAGISSLTQILSFDVAATFVAIYVMLFALVLLVFECRTRSIDEYLRINYGFLYSSNGLGIYLVFMGVLDLGLTGGLFGVVAGTCACVSAFLTFSTGCSASPYSPQERSPARSTLASAPRNTTTLKSTNEKTAPPTYGSSTFAAQKPETESTAVTIEIPTTSVSPSKSTSVPASLQVTQGSVPITTTKHTRSKKNKK